MRKAAERQLPSTSVAARNRERPLASAYRMASTVPATGYGTAVMEGSNG